MAGIELDVDADAELRPERLRDRRLLVAEVSKIPNASAPRQRPTVTPRVTGSDDHAGRGDSIPARASDSRQLGGGTKILSVGVSDACRGTSAAVTAGAGVSTICIRNESRLMNTTLDCSTLDSSPSDGSLTLHLSRGHYTRSSVSVVCRVG